MFLVLFFSESLVYAKAFDLEDKIHTVMVGMLS